MTIPIGKSDLLKHCIKGVPINSTWKMPSLFVKIFETVTKESCTEQLASEFQNYSRLYKVFRKTLGYFFSLMITTI